MSQAYDLLYYHTQTEPQSSGKYFGLSMMLHASLVLASFFVVVPAMDHLKNEVVTIELQTEEKPIPPPPKILETPRGEKIAKTRGAKRVLAPAPSAPKHAELGPKIAGPARKSRTSHAKASQIKTHIGGGKSAVAKSAPSRAGSPETLEDIAAPDLDAGIEVAQVGKLGDNEFENDFKNVDRSNQAALAAEKSQMDEEAQQIADEKDAALKALADDNAAEAKAMEDALNATRTKNAATLAQMKATERAAAERAARDREAAALAAAAAAKNHGSGDGQPIAGRGNGSEGSDELSGTRSGIPSGIRSLDQLKQMPGNPKPQYSNDERLKRHQGQVVFYAYVTTEGRTAQFKMAQSTGFRNLDGKTLAALKKWKFYPGQQGWVEIPFKWDIKGGVQEMPTLLRRVGSRN